MPKFCCVLFSYNRAMLLDMTLRSLSENMAHKDIQYAVVYHCAPGHRESYDKLISEWEPAGVRFILRDERPRRLTELLGMLKRPTNLYRYLRKPKMRRFIDNFKELVEGAIHDSKAPFAFFCTDDQYVLAETYIPDAALDLIRNDPKNVTLRLGLSDSFAGREELPEGLAVERIEYMESGHSGTLLSWHGNDPEATKLWEYSFNVDLQVFDSAALLEFLKPILYHMPTTLEAFGVKESRSRNYFRQQIGTSVRTVTGVQANNVQTMVDNPAMNYSPEHLRDLYDMGYRLVIDDSSIPQDQFIYMPDKLFFRKVGSPPEVLHEYADLVSATSSRDNNG